MALTAEGTVKAAITKRLKKLGCWYFMPVSCGYGVPTLDYICSLGGRTFCIEAKAPGKKPTQRQVATMVNMGRHDVPSIVVTDSSKDAIDYMEAWILMVTSLNRDGRPPVAPTTKALWGEGASSAQSGWVHDVWSTDNERK